MAFTVNRVPVPASTSPTQVVGSTRGTYRRLVRVMNLGTAPVWLGDSDVTTDGGYRIDPGDEYAHDQPDELYAIANSATRLVTIGEAVA